MPRKARVRFPALPKTIEAAGGPVTVELRENIVNDGQECWGLYDPAHRRIYIDKGIPPRHRWKVLYHEQVHVALLDAGLDNGIDDRLHEAICDAIATARVRERFG